MPMIYKYLMFHVGEDSIMNYSGALSTQDDYFINYQNFLSEVTFWRVPIFSNTMTGSTVETEVISFWFYDETHSTFHLLQIVSNSSVITLACSDHVQKFFTKDARKLYEKAYALIYS